MTVDRDRVWKALNAIADDLPDTFNDMNSVTGVSDDEKNVIFSFLSFYGVVEIENGQFKIVSDTARLFIKSIAEYMRIGKKLIPVWNDREHSSGLINASNVFLSSNFLRLTEDARKKACDNSNEFNPIFKGTTVRVVIVRRVWWHNRYLMQYSERVGKYQLIGGILLHGDKNHETALRRKLTEEVPELVEAGREPKLNEIFCSQREDEEIFFSKRHNVYARYKTFIYSLTFMEKISRTVLNNISKNKANRWVTIKEIEREKAKDGKEIFHLVPTAIAELKKLEPNIRVKKYELSVLLEETWVRVIVCLCGVTGVTALSIITKAIPALNSLFSRLLSLFGQS